MEGLKVLALMQGQEHMCEYSFMLRFKWNLVTLNNCTHYLKNFWCTEGAVLLHMVHKLSACVLSQLAKLKVYSVQNSLNVVALARVWTFDKLEQVRDQLL